MKNIVVGILTLVVVGLMVLTFLGGRAYHGGEHGKVIADLGNRVAGATASSAAPEDKSDRQKEEDKLTALRDKAGNVGGFEVSDEYKSKCASCHGVNGSGFQNGKKMMGPKLFGQSSDEIYKMLAEFKAGRRENIVMKGLLMGLNDDDLQRFANEIGEFPARKEALDNK
jgi:cytochrome c553